MTTIDTKHLRELAEAATPGGRTPAGSLIVADGGATVGQAFGINWRNDQAYLAAIDPPTLIALLDEVERLRGDTEWEHGVHLGASDEVRAHSTRGMAVADARAVSTIIHPDGGVEIFERTLMRRKVGPWEPVEGETNE